VVSAVLKFIRVLQSAAVFIHVSVYTKFKQFWNNCAVHIPVRQMHVKFCFNHLKEDHVVNFKPTKMKCLAAIVF